MVVWFDFWLWDIGLVIKWFKRLKDKIFPWTNPQDESLKQDIDEIFTNNMAEFVKVSWKIPELPDNSKEMLWNNYAELMKYQKVLEWEEVNRKEWHDFMEKQLNKYIKKWYYWKMINGAMIKMKSYISCFRECRKEYGKNDWKKLKKERKLLEKYLKENRLELKRWFIDLMLSLVPEKAINEEIKHKITREEKEVIIDKLMENFDIEKFVPIFNNIFNELEERVLVK